MNQQLAGQTVAVLGGSAGIGFESARLARDAGAEVVVTGRNPERLREAAEALRVTASTPFDATDPDALDAFFAARDEPLDHVLVTAGGPYYGLLADLDFAQAQRTVDEHVWLAIRVARHALTEVHPGGSLLFLSGTGARRPKPGLSVAGAINAAMPALTRNLALEVAPVRVNLIAPGFVDTPLSAALLGDELDARREQLRAELPIRRVVEPADVGALAVHLMANTALTGATFDVDGGQQLVTGL